jgi:hypothetical protein
MSLTRWLIGIAVLVGLGALRVTQHNALLRAGYRVGALSARVHAQETQLALRHTEVLGMASPTALARVANERDLKLVAWATVDGPSPLAQVAAAGREPED